MAIAETIFIHIPLQMFSRDMVVCTIYATLKLRPKTFNTVSVNIISRNINLLRVCYGFMVEAEI